MAKVLPCFNILIRKSKRTISPLSDITASKNSIQVSFKIFTCFSYFLKSFFSIGIQLVRLVGCVDSLRPVLEALFHRMVLLPIASKRLEPLRSIRELLRSPERIVDLLLLPESKDKPSNSDDMAIIRL